MSRVQQLRFGEMSDDDKAVIGIPFAGFTGVDDLVCMAVLGGGWLLLQLVMGTVAYVRKRNPRVFDANLLDPLNRLCDNTVIPELRVKGTVRRMTETASHAIKRVVRSPSRLGTTRQRTRDRGATVPEGERESMLDVLPPVHEMSA